jgi:hypothetical protein
MAYGMRIESGDQRRATLRARAFHRATDHRLVAKVKSIEIAKRDDPRAQGCGNHRAAVEPLHERAIRPGLRLR